MTPGDRSKRHSHSGERGKEATAVAAAAAAAEWSNIRNAWWERAQAKAGESTAPVITTGRGEDWVEREAEDGIEEELRVAERQGETVARGSR